MNCFGTSRSLQSINLGLISIVKSLGSISQSQETLLDKKMKKKAVVLKKTFFFPFFFFCWEKKKEPIVMKNVQIPIMLRTNYLKNKE